jgi:hypothetical protein
MTLPADLDDAAAASRPLDGWPTGGRRPGSRHVGLNQGFISTPRHPFGGMKRAVSGEGIEEYLATKFVRMAYS